MMRRIADQLGAPAPILDVASIRSEKWQRLSPVSIIYFIAKFITGAVRNSIQTFAVAPAAIIATTGENRWLILAIFAFSSTVALIIGSVISFLKFKYRIEGDKFLIRSGVFKRKRLSLGFDRIQNVALKEPIYFRPFGLVIMALESAGSSAEEVSLGGIPRVAGQAIREHVLSFKGSHSGADNGTKKSASESAALLDEENIQAKHDDELLLAQPISELVRYGISNNNIWVFAGIFAAFVSQIDEWWIGDFTSGITDNIDAAASAGLIIIAVLVMAGVFLILGALMLISIIGAIIVNYNYRLSYQDGRYHRTRGLLERQETSVPEVKIQNLQIAMPFIAKLIKRAHITVGQVGFRSKNNNKRQQKFIIPSVKDAFTTNLIGHIYDGSNVLSIELKPINNLFVVRHYFLSVLPILAFYSVPVALAFDISDTQILYTAGLTFLTSLAILPLIILRCKRYGYATNGDTGIVRTGFLGEIKTVFPFYKVQNVKLIQSPGQRRRGLATLKINLAGKTLSIPYMPIEDARKWRDMALYRVETSKRPWM